MKNWKENDWIWCNHIQHFLIANFSKMIQLTMNTIILLWKITILKGKPALPLGFTDNFMCYTFFLTKNSPKLKGCKFWQLYTKNVWLVFSDKSLYLIENYNREIKVILTKKPETEFIHTSENDWIFSQFFPHLY